MRKTSEKAKSRSLGTYEISKNFDDDDEIEDDQRAINKTYVLIQ